MTIEKIPVASDVARGMSIFGDKQMLMIGATTIIVTAAVYGYRAFRAYQAKKHHAKIQKINELHQKYLETIVVPQVGKIKGLPSIFQFENNEVTSPVQSMHFTDNQIEDIGTNTSVRIDPGLLAYQRNIKNAIFKLKDYYLERDKKEDITAGVLSYLIHILNEKCTQFSGYKIDIEYMEAIARFINAYASIKGIDNSQHFSRLSVVYRYISKAKQELIKYQGYLSLEYFIGQLATCSMTNSDQLLRSFTKLIIKKDRYSLLNTVAQDELKKGILRQEYVKRQFKGFEYAKHHQIDLPESIFKNWIMNLANFYLKSESPDKNLQEMDEFSPEIMIHYLQKQDNNLAHQYLNLQEKNTQKAFEKQLYEIQSIFKNTSHFITSKLDKGCGLYLKKAEKNILEEEVFENSNDDHLYLYKDEKGLSFYISGKKHTIRKESFIEPVSKLFNSMAFMKNNVLENDLLNSETRLACHLLLDYTSKRGYTKSSKKHSHPVFTPITDMNEVMERVNVMAKLAKLIYTLILLQYFCIHMLNSIKKLGDIYVKDPRHFVEIFNLLENLCSKICNDIENLQKNFITIQKENDNAMRIESEEMIPKKIEALMSNTKFTIIDLIKDITDYRNKAKNLVSKSEKRIVNSEMLKLAQKISNMTGIDNHISFMEKKLQSSHRKNSLSNSSLLKEKESDQVQPQNVALAETNPKEIEMNPCDKQKMNSTAMQFLDPMPLEIINQANEPVSPTIKMPVLQGISPSVKSIKAGNEKKDIEKLQNILSSIKEKITGMRSESSNIKRLMAYQKIYDYLNIMANKSISLVHQKNKSDTRTNKANRTFELIDKIAGDTLQYLNLNDKSRQENRTEFANIIHEKITCKKNSTFIDEHQNKISKFIYTHICSFWIFKTDTRRKLSKMDAAYQQLVKH